jgi:flavodoxin
MKKIFIYYSLSGNGDVVATYLKTKNIDVRKVIIKDKMPKSYIGQILKGGFLAGINYKMELDNFDNNTDNYDEIIIGSPIWNGRLACPINTVLDNIDLNKRISFVLYSGSGEAPKAEKMIKEGFGNVNIIVLKDPKKNIDDMKMNLDNFV